MSAARRRLDAARIVNLFIPGGGLVLHGSLAAGVLVALVFTAAAGLALAGTLLFPDDVWPSVRGFALLAAGGSYVAAQAWLTHVCRAADRSALAQRRRQALRDATDALQRGDGLAAADALAAVVSEADHDLAVAHLRAEVLTAIGDVEAARLAWQAVRALDRHGIYRQQLHAAEQRLAQPGGSA